MTAETFFDGRVSLYCGDSREVLKGIQENSIDSICTDPPYALVSIVKRFGKPGSAAAKAYEGGSGVYGRASSGFMGQQWDTGETAFSAEFWSECLRVLKPGGHVVSFSGTRTYHRMACAIEDAGFEIRDSLMWVYGQGFPKSQNVAKFIDKELGFDSEETGTRKIAIDKWTAEGRRRLELGETGHYEIATTDPVSPQAQEFNGFGTALKPAFEPICLARKPLSEGTVAANVLRWRTGALNIDGCRVESGADYHDLQVTQGVNTRKTSYAPAVESRTFKPAEGRWPANVVHDGSNEVVGAFPDTKSGYSDGTKSGIQQSVFGKYGAGQFAETYGDAGSAARFFYSAKADADDRLGSKHPTVKPVDLKQYLVRLVTPPSGTVLDPFAGTGTTGEAAWREGFNAILIEREAEYQSDIRRRMALCLAGPDERARESIKARTKDLPVDAGPLFGVVT